MVKFYLLKTIDIEVETELMHNDLPINNIGKEELSEVNNISELNIDDIKSNNFLVPDFIINGSRLLKRKIF